ncbi:uncharacterized protein LOC127861832 [Dreissena polymorpha]|uniref:uncharacterized protein LOC127861832 n=1 Tax=Dreissena polymorpha TaxID=45954 RepID=UPI002264DADD|nr:uncharacterized protein LOC127861832 [Dreissena polymorpha]
MDRAVISNILIKAGVSNPRCVNKVRIRDIKEVVTPKTITKTAVRNIVQIRQNTSTFSDVQGYKNLKLCSINCRSVKNKTLSICDFVLTNDYDLVALTETWLGSSVDEVCVSKLVPSGYEIKHVPRCDVVITRDNDDTISYIDVIDPGFSNSDWKLSMDHFAVSMNVRASKPVPVRKTVSFRKFRSIDVDLFKNDLRPLCSLRYHRPRDTACTARNPLRNYRAATGNYLQTTAVNSLSATAFLEEEWPTFLSKYVTIDKNIIIVGDLNFHLDVPSNRETIKFLSILDACGLKQHVNKPTHVAGHILDVVITRDNDDTISYIDVIDLGFSNSDGKLSMDHFAVTMNVRASKPVPVRKTVSFRKFRSIDVDLFKNDLRSSAILNSESCLTSVDELADSYESELSLLIDKHAPLRTKSIILRPTCPWYN